MPNCFQLFRKGVAEPMILQKVDDEMRVAFGAPADDKHWFNGWYDYIGFLCALGKSWDEIRADNLDGLKSWPDDPDYAKHVELNARIIDWLDANFTTSSWAEIGKR